MAQYKTLVDKVSIPPNMKTKQKDYESQGTLAIVDQGKKLIGGYTNNAEMALQCKLPVIVFGDHTCAVKFVNFPFGAGADGIKVLSPKSGILPKYLFYGTQYLTLRFPDKGYARHYQHIEKMDLPVPSIETQQNIVSSIEELFSELDKGVETLQTIKEQLAVYRQTVLKEALNGIKGQPYTVKDVCKEIKVGIVIKPSQYYTDEQVGIKAFRSANVREFHVEDKNWAYLSIAGHQANARSIVHTGDILIVRSGYPGTACVVPEQFNGCNAIDILIAVPNRDLVLPEFLCAYTNSPLGKKFVNEKKRGVGQKHFNVSGYSKMLISVPSLDKQEEIVKKIASRLSVCDSIERTVNTALAQAEAMRQSILKKAFEGELCK